MTDGYTAVPFTELNKFVFCRPHGGFNDILCQVELCWRYAERFDRALVLDGQTCGMLGSFAPYFVPKANKIPVFTNVTEELFAHLNALTCYPHSIQGRLDKYISEIQPDLNKMVVSDSREKLAFDRKRDYSEQVLVHEQFGGGTRSRAGLSRLTLSPDIVSLVESALEKLPRSYIGIHVRNTDRRTDYKELFEKLFVKVTGRNVLICSDDPSVLSFGRKYFELSKVYTSSEPPDLGGDAIHVPWNHHEDSTRRGAVLSSIIDLLALGGAEKLYFGRAKDRRFSGFSLLAKYISKNKWIRDSLLRRS